MKKIVFISIIFLSVLPSMAADYLFDNGYTAYSIVVPSTASTSEKTAATELQTYLRQISGCTLPLISDIPSSGRYIYVGYSGQTGVFRPSSTDESFTYRVKSGNLYIWGGSDRGTMYGVYSFLENELGVRWYTSEYTLVPKRKRYALKNLNHTEKPVLEKRLDYYHSALIDPVWCAHNKMNESNKTKINNYGNISAFYGIHTMFTLVPPDKYFSTHPEYYSLVKGKRQSDKGQLCLSNPDVLKIAETNLLQIIREYPDYWVYDVSQMDNQNYCKCDQCTALANQYGGQSGLMVWFVNQVADYVEKYYPKKKIGTFAYLYTRHAPTCIVPRRNVVIRLCDIECCFAHPLTDASCTKNTAFMSDLQDWGKLTSSIYIWDYVVNFHNYLVPYPNFSVIKDNIITFSRNGAMGVMEEGAHEARWAEFCEMRQWIIAKLLWNPYQEVNALAREFCYDYYGNAGDAVYNYYLATQQIPSTEHVIYRQHYEKNCYTDAFLIQYMNTLEQAVRSVSTDNIKTKRVNRVLAQVYYMYSARHLEQAKSNGIYQKLKDILSKDPTNIWEGHNDLDTHIKSQGYT